MANKHKNWKLVKDSGLIQEDLAKTQSGNAFSGDTWYPILNRARFSFSENNNKWRL